MIQSLSIKNYALISDLKMNPSEKLNIITGETGAGKSIMLGAIGLLLGKRADTKALFSDTQKCIIEATFLLSENFKVLFEQLDLDFELECIIRREISPAGKSRSFINDTPVTLDILKSLGVYLMDVHSQYESLDLGNNIYQLNVLDQYALHEDLISSYKSAFKKFTSAEKNLHKLQDQTAQNNKNREYNSFLLEELEALNLSDIDQEQLEEELKRLENAEEIKINLGQINGLLAENEFNVVDSLRTAVQLLSPFSSMGKSLNDLYERLLSSAYELDDISREAARENDAIDVDQERLLEVKQIIDALNKLLIKHNVKSVQKLIALRDNLQSQMEIISDTTRALTNAQKEVIASEKIMLQAANKLSLNRKKYSSDLSKAIQYQVRGLGIENAVVEIKISPCAPEIHGMDNVELLFSANKGIPVQEIKSVASGGEFSRLIFAIKYLLADKVQLPTIVFDEIDTGVSGEIALKMIKMMKKMAASHQVIAISHLPQFAAGGDIHYFVYKDHSAAKSVSRIKILDGETRIDEIAKMISGAIPTENAKLNARELIESIGSSEL
ncbi:MAG: DNA repair protein RecN (Recombination protein N) [Cyclobacteriaceae bacterium]|jgi:DNA repair protein RecN (Recombination protein N)